MPELVQFEVEAVSPLNVTVPVVPVKLLPAIAMGAPGSPVGGVNNVILGGGSVTVNVGPVVLETPPAAVTATGPVVAVPGTTAVMLLVVQLVVEVAGVPLKLTALPVP